MYSQRIQFIFLFRFKTFFSGHRQGCVTSVQEVSHFVLFFHSFSSSHELVSDHTSFSFLFFSSAAATSTIVKSSVYLSSYFLCHFSAKCFLFFHSDPNCVNLGSTLLLRLGGVAEKSPTHPANSIRRHPCWLSGIRVQLLTIIFHV